MEIDLIYRFKTHKYLQLDKSKSFVFNVKKGKITPTRWNCRSLGIWVGRKFIPISKWQDNIEFIDEFHELKEMLK